MTTTTIMPIVRTFFGTHIDLSKVVSISDARLDVSETRHSTGLRVGFQIIVQLRDAPIDFSCALEATEARYPTREDGSTDWYKRDLAVRRPGPLAGMSETVWLPMREAIASGFPLVAVTNLQAQIDPLVERWKYVTTGRHTVPL